MKLTLFKIERSIEADQNIAALLLVIKNKSMTVREIAKVMNKPEPSIRTYVSQIKDHLITTRVQSKNGKYGHSIQWNGVEFVVRTYEDFGVENPNPNGVPKGAKVYIFGKDYGVDHIGDWNPMSRKSAKNFTSGSTLSQVI